MHRALPSQLAAGRVAVQNSQAQGKPIAANGMNQ
jgi:hypothetical protein